MTGMLNRLGALLAAEARQGRPHVPGSRWIIIAMVKRNWFVIDRQMGAPGGIWAHWKGETHPFQPVEFLNDRQFQRAAEHRLKKAGLRAEEFGADEPAIVGWVNVPVRVTRLYARKQA